VHGPAPGPRGYLPQTAPERGTCQRLRRASTGSLTVPPVQVSRSLTTPRNVKRHPGRPVAGGPRLHRGQFGHAVSPTVGVTPPRLSVRRHPDDRFFEGDIAEAPATTVRPYPSGTDRRPGTAEWSGVPWPEIHPIQYAAHARGNLALTVSDPTNTRHLARPGSAASRSRYSTCNADPLREPSTISLGFVACASAMGSGTPLILDSPRDTHGESHETPTVLGAIVSVQTVTRTSWTSHIGPARPMLHRA